MQAVDKWQVRYGKFETEFKKWVERRALYIVCGKKTDV